MSNGTHAKMEQIVRFNLCLFTKAKGNERGQGGQEEESAHGSDTIQLAWYAGR